MNTMYGLEEEKLNVNTEYKTNDGYFEVSIADVLKESQEFLYYKEYYQLFRISSIYVSLKDVNNNRKIYLVIDWSNNVNNKNIKGNKNVKIIKENSNRNIGINFRTPKVQEKSGSKYFKADSFNQLFVPKIRILSEEKIILNGTIIIRCLFKKPYIDQSGIINSRKSREEFEQPIAIKEPVLACRDYKKRFTKEQINKIQSKNKIVKKNRFKIINRKTVLLKNVKNGKLPEIIENAKNKIENERENKIEDKKKNKIEESEEKEENKIEEDSDEEEVKQLFGVNNEAIDIRKEIKQRLQAIRETPSKTVNFEQMNPRFDIYSIIKRTTKMNNLEDSNVNLNTDDFEQYYPKFEKKLINYIKKMNNLIELRKIKEAVVYVDEQYNKRKTAEEDLEGIFEMFG